MGRILAVVLAGGVEPLGEAAFIQTPWKNHHRGTEITEGSPHSVEEHDAGPILWALCASVVKDSCLMRRNQEPSSSGVARTLSAVFSSSLAAIMSPGE